MKLISKALRIARVKGITQFYYPPYVYPQMEGVILPLLPAAEHHRTLASIQVISRRQEAELAWVAG